MTLGNENKASANNGKKSWLRRSVAGASYPSAGASIAAMIGQMNRPGWGLIGQTFGRLGRDKGPRRVACKSRPGLSLTVLFFDAAFRFGTIENSFEDIGIFSFLTSQETFVVSMKPAIVFDIF